MGSSLDYTPVKRSLLLLAKIAVSLCLLAYLFSTTDLGRPRAARPQRRHPALRGGHGALQPDARSWPPGAGGSCCRPRASRLRCATSPRRTWSPPSSTTSSRATSAATSCACATARASPARTTTSLAVVAIDRILGIGALYVLAAVAFVAGGPAVRAPRRRARRSSPASGLFFALLAYVFFRPGTARRLMARSRPQLAWPGRSSSSRRSRPPSTSTDSASATSGAPSAPASPYRPSSSLLLRRRPRAAHPPLVAGLLPDGSAVHPRADRARLLQRLGDPRERLHPLLRTDRPAPRERPRLQPRGRRPHRAPLASRAPSSGPREAAAARPRRRSEPMPVAVLHVCDKFGVAGSSIHGVSRLFSWWFPRYDPARFEVSLCGLKAPEPASRLLESQGIPVHHLGRGRFDPRILGGPRGPRAPTRRADPPRPRLRRRRLRPPRRASPRAPGSSSTSTSPIRGCPPTRASPTACSPASPTAPSRSATPPRDFLVARAARARRPRPPDLERRAARRVRPGRPASAPCACAASSGIPEGALVVGTIGRLNEQKGHRYLLDAARLVLERAPETRAS